MSGTECNFGSTLPIAIDPVTFHLLWHRRSHDHPAQRWFRETIIAAAA